MAGRPSGPLEQFGQIEIDRYVDTIVPGEDEPKSQTQQFQRTDSVFAGEASRIPPPSPKRGVSGLYKTRLTRDYYSTVTGFDRLLPKPMPGVAGCEPRPIEDEEMKPWDLEDLEYLGLELGPDDDVNEILGTPHDKPSVSPEATVPEAVEPQPDDDGLFGKLKDFFRKGGER